MQIQFLIKTVYNKEQQTEISHIHISVLKNQKKNIKIVCQKLLTVIIRCMLKICDLISDFSKILSYKRNGTKFYNYYTADSLHINEYTERNLRIFKIIKSIGFINDPSANPYKLKALQNNFIPNIFHSVFNDVSETNINAV